MKAKKIKYLIIIFIFVNIIGFSVPGRNKFKSILINDNSETKNDSMSNLNLGNATQIYKAFYEKELEYLNIFLKNNSFKKDKNNSILEDDLTYIKILFDESNNLVNKLNEEKGKFDNFGIQLYKANIDFFYIFKPKNNNDEKLLNEIKQELKKNEKNYIYFLRIVFNKDKNDEKNLKTIGKSFNILSYFNFEENEFWKILNYKLNLKEFRDLFEIIKLNGREIANKYIDLVFENGNYMLENNIRNFKNKKIVLYLLKNLFFTSLFSIANESYEFPNRILKYSQEEKIKKIITNDLLAEQACRNSIIKHLNFDNIINIYSIFKKFSIYKTSTPELRQISILDNIEYPGYFCINGDLKKEYFVVYPSYQDSTLKAKKLDPSKYIKRLESFEKTKLETEENKEFLENNIKKKEIAENLILSINNSIKDKVNTKLLN